MLPATPVLRQAWLELAESIYLVLEHGATSSGALEGLLGLLPAFSADVNGRLQLLSHLGRLQHLLGLHEKARETFLAAAALASQFADPLVTARVQHDLATTYFHLRQFQRAGQYAALAAAAYRQIPNTENRMASIENLLGNITKDRGDLVNAQAHYEEAIRLWRSLRSTHNLVRSLNNLAQTLEQLGHTEEAVALYDEALDLLAHYNDPRDRTLILLSLGTLYYNLGRYDEAARTFTRIDGNYLQRAGLQEYQALALNNRGNIAYVQGRFAEAKTQLEEAADIWQRLNEGVRLANSLSRLGDVQRQLGDIRAAEYAYEEAIRLARQYPEDARARQILAETESDLAQLWREGGWRPARTGRHPEEETGA